MRKMDNVYLIVQKKRFELFQLFFQSESVYDAAAVAEDLIEFNGVHAVELYVNGFLMFNYIRPKK